MYIVNQDPYAAFNNFMHGVVVRKKILLTYNIFQNRLLLSEVLICFDPNIPVLWFCPCIETRNTHVCVRTCALN